MEPIKNDGQTSHPPEDASERGTNEASDPRGSSARTLALGRSSNGTRQKYLRRVVIFVCLAAILLIPTELILNLRGNDTPVLRACVLLTLLALVIWLFTKAKGCVLLLRRFRETHVNEIFTRTIEVGLSRSYRIITLDDSSFRPLGAPK